MSRTVLIVDDEKSIVDILKFNLEKSEYSTICAYDGKEALKLAREKSPDLMLLDVMLPYIDGFEVCKTLRSEGSNIPIIMITAREEETDKVFGLELGADDYITKPFVVEELVAKVKAHLRREQRHNATSSNTITIGDLQIYPDRFEVLKAGESIQLTTREFQLLVYLAEHSGKVLTREQLFDAIWGMDYSDIGTVTVTIKNLRDKLDPGNHLIKTVWGVGYKLVRQGVLL